MFYVNEALNLTSFIWIIQTTNYVSAHRETVCLTKLSLLEPNARHVHIYDVIILFKEGVVMIKIFLLLN